VCYVHAPWAVEHQPLVARSPRALHQTLQQAATDALAPTRGAHVHALDLRRPFVDGAQAGRTDDRASVDGQQQSAARWGARAWLVDGVIEVLLDRSDARLERDRDAVVPLELGHRPAVVLVPQRSDERTLGQDVGLPDRHDRLPRAAA